MKGVYFSLQFQVTCHCCEQSRQECQTASKSHAHSRAEKTECTHFQLLAVLSRISPLLQFRNPCLVNGTVLTEVAFPVSVICNTFPQISPQAKTMQRTSHSFTDDPAGSGLYNVDSVNTGPQSLHFDIMEPSKLQFGDCICCDLDFNYPLKASVFTYSFMTSLWDFSKSILCHWMLPLEGIIGTWTWSLFSSFAF